VQLDKGVHMDEEYKIPVVEDPAVDTTDDEIEKLRIMMAIQRGRRVFAEPSSPVGITRASHEQSKKARKQARKSRKLNRKK
jgi:hypothetical protein